MSQCGQKKIYLSKKKKKKIKDLSVGLVYDIGIGRFLEWGEVKARELASRVLDFWDNRGVQSRRFKNYDMGVYSPSSGWDIKGFWA